MNSLLIVIRSSSRVFDYYNKRFLDPDEDIYRLQKSVITSQIFDPSVLREADIERLYALPDELLHSGHDKYFSSEYDFKFEKRAP